MTERLYLCKGEMDLGVDLKQPCPQHQLDAVRFLYRLFKLKQPGAILNDPSGYGKRVQVALFITAILPLLKSSSKLVLILCDDGFVEYWRNLIEEWGDINDISTNSTTLSKNVIRINPHKDGATMSRRQWGIVIVDREDMTKDLQILFKTDFKIWITNIDLKQNLQAFTSVYNWINPNNKFNMQDFVPKDNSLKEVVGKSLLFDAFLEDTVLRRNNFQSLFDISEKPKRVHAESPKKSVKNKDPTGTKVKRTKKRRIDHEDVIQNTANNKMENPIATNSGIKSDDIHVKNDTSLKTECDLDTIGDAHCEVDNSPEKQLKRSKIFTDDTKTDFSVDVEDHNTSAEKHNEDEVITKETRDFTTMNNQKDWTNDNIESKKQVINNEVQGTKEKCIIEASLNVQNKDNEVIVNKNNDNQIDELNNIQNEIDESSKNTLHVVQNERRDTNEIDELKSNENITDDTNKEVQPDGESSNKKKSVMSSLKEMEDKLLEYERKAAERYKGSFLDSII